MTIMTRSGAKFWWKKDLPKHIIYLYHDEIKREWQEYTRAYLNAEKKYRQELNIDKKRYCYRKVPCFIHVFYLNTGFLLDGWYITVWSAYGTWYLKRRAFDGHKKLFPKIKQHLSMGLLPIADDDTWFEEFCKACPMKPKGTQKPRGKYLTHCIIDSCNSLIDIELGQGNSRDGEEQIDAWKPF